MRIFVYLLLFTTVSYAQENRKFARPRPIRENETGGRPSLIFNLPRQGSSSSGNQVDISSIRDLIALLSSKNPSSQSSNENEVSSRPKSSVELPANYRNSGGPGWSSGLSAYRTGTIPRITPISEPNPDQIDVPILPPTNRRYSVAVPQPDSADSEKQTSETGKNPVNVPVFILVPVPYKIDAPESSNNKPSNTEKVSLQTQEELAESEQTPEQQSAEEDESEDASQRIVRAHVGIPQSYIVREQVGIPQTFIGRDQEGIPQAYVLRDRLPVDNPEWYRQQVYQQQSPLYY